ncbi:unnamed protein product, partial [Allacma fusca]
SQHRARINLIFVFLPAISYFFFKREKSYPLNAGDINFVHFTFWVMVTLLHTVKSMYLATSKVIRPVPMVPAREAERRAEPPEYEMMLPPANPHPSPRVNPYPTIKVQHLTEDNLAAVNQANANNEDFNEGFERATPKNTELDLKISAKPKRVIPISTELIDDPEYPALIDKVLDKPDSAASSTSGLELPKVHTEGNASQCQIDTNKNAMLKEVLDCFAEAAPEEGKSNPEENISDKETISAENSSEPNDKTGSIQNSKNESQS